MRADSLGVPVTACRSTGSPDQVVEALLEGLPGFVGIQHAGSAGLAVCTYADQGGAVGGNRNRTDVEFLAEGRQLVQEPGFHAVQIVGIQPCDTLSVDLDRFEGPGHRIQHVQAGIVDGYFLVGHPYIDDRDHLVHIASKSSIPTTC
jgi:hypothetical protein